MSPFELCGEPATMNSTFRNHFQPGLQPKPLVQRPTGDRSKHYFFKEDLKRNLCGARRYSSVLGTARDRAMPWVSHQDDRREETLQILITRPVSSRVINHLSYGRQSLNPGGRPQKSSFLFVPPWVSHGLRSLLPVPTPHSGTSVSPARSWTTFSKLRETWERRLGRDGYGTCL